MKKNYELGKTYTFAKPFERGFITIPEGTNCVITKIEGEMLTLGFEGLEELTFPMSYLDSFIVPVIKLDELNKMGVRFELPSDEELEESQRKIGDGAPPSLVVIAYDPDQQKEDRFYLHAFRAYCFQVSGSITGRGDYGSSPICDLPEIADMDRGRGIILSLIAYAVNDWVNHNSRLVGNWRFRPQDFAAGFGDEYQDSAKWLDATIAYLKTRTMGGFKK